MRKPYHFAFVQAVLGGPVLGEDNRIIGMSIDVGHVGPRANAYVSYLPLALLHRYLEHFRILKYVFYISSIYELYLPLLAYVTFVPNPAPILLSKHWSIGNFYTVICRFIIIWFLVPLPDGYLRQC